MSINASHRKRLLAVAIGCSLLVSSAASALTLEQAVSQTLVTEPEIQQAFQRYKESEEQINIAKSEYLPTIDLNGGYGREMTDSPSTRASNNNSSVSLNRREMGLSLRQILFNGFFTVNDVERASRIAKSQHWGLINIAEDKALEVVGVYIQYLRTEQIHKLSRQNLSNHERIFRQIKKKTNSGLASTSDLSQISGRLARAKANLVSATNNLQDAAVQFKRLINSRPDNLFMPKPDAQSIPGTLQNAINRSEENHPALKVAGEEIEAITARRNQTQSSFYPNVSLELNGNWNNNLDGVEGDNNDLQAMVKVDYNLFSGGGDIAKYRQSSHQVNQAKENRQQVYREIVEGTSLSWNAHQNLQEQTEFVRQHVVAAKASQQAFEKQFSIGRRSLMELLDSENELFEARIDYINAEFDTLNTSFRLLHATGQLLSSMNVALPSTWNKAEGEFWEKFMDLGENASVELFNQ
ncbi:TolC family outer membrane protein [Veronia pacifica]|uniref:Channel protein TolC n=1 Tax=Veronia pacifica TaxID=1080227 RepID=A0A1C3E7T9_9GAMM|nr:TolC family outer membrane protein [Veronia pacifica]ODA29219.1 hypothetical protein A8L45_22570 [Veronia pacifica]